MLSIEEMELVVNLLAEKYGPDYSDGTIASDLQVKLLIMIERDIALKQRLINRPNRTLEKADKGPRTFS